MKSIITTAILTFRENVRSKLVLALVAGVTFITLWMPWILRGDGSTDSYGRMILLYPISVAFGFLALNALWTSSASISGDVKNRTLQLVRVKPIPMYRLWIGKWIGLLFLFALILAIPFIGSHLYLSCGCFAARNDTLLTTKELHSPILPSVKDQVDEAMRNATANAKMSPEEIRALRTDLMHQLPYATAALPTGQTWVWHYTLPEGNGDAPLFLRIKLNTDSLSANRPIAKCTLRQRGADSGYDFTIDEFSNREIEFAIPPGILQSSGEIELVIKNVGHDGAPAIMTQPRQWLHLMRGAGSLASNMVRAYAVLLSILALLLAIGLSAGAFFTMPVAVFATTCMILTASICGYVASDQSMLEPDYTTPPSPIVRLQTAFSVGVVKSISFITAPALEPSPISHLSESEKIEGRDVMRSVICDFIAIPAFLALISSCYLARKELPE